MGTGAAVFVQDWLGLPNETGAAHSEADGEGVECVNLKSC